MGKKHAQPGFEWLRISNAHYLKCVGGPDPGRKSRLFTFKKGVNLAIGPNGSGKSTLLEALFYSVGWKKGKPKAGLHSKGGAGSYYRFDFEKDNPRGRTDGFMMLDFTALRMHFTAMRHSHGETTAKLMELLSAEKKTAERCLLLDEPEQALDPAGLAQLRKVLLGLKAPQVIVATHALPLILEPQFHVVELRSGYRQELAQQALGYADKAAQVLAPQSWKDEVMTENSVMVKKGQLWADTDPWMWGRVVRVDSVVLGAVFCTVVQPPFKVSQATVRRTVGRCVRISESRFGCSAGNGYMHLCDDA